MKDYLEVLITRMKKEKATTTIRRKKRNKSIIICRSFDYKA